MLGAQPIPSLSTPLPASQLTADDGQLNREEIASLLRSRPSSLRRGKSIHASIVNSGLQHDGYIGNLLISLYRECRSLEDVRRMFHVLHERSVVPWTVMMAALCDHSLCNDAIHVFHDMHRHGFEPNHVTFITILNACTDEHALADGNTIHASIVDHGLHHEIVVATSLINMYGRCGNIHSACIIFDQVEHRDLFLWNTMIAGYSQCGLRKQAFTLLKQMQDEGVMPNQVTYIHALSACSSAEGLEDGKLVHTGILESGLGSDVTVGTALVNMYGKCGAPQLARAAFDNISSHDVISWTTMIAVHSSHGQVNEAFELFESFDQKLYPNQATIVNVLNACADLERGQMVHSCAVEYGYESDAVVGTALVNVYGRCGLLEDAWLVFDKIQSRDCICWNSMISLCSQLGNVSQALFFFEEMQRGGLEPDSLTFNGLLCACASPAALLNGKWIHECVKAKGFESDIIVSNALINMYSKCGSWEEAFAIFEKMDEHNLSSWNSIIAGCCQHGHAEDALRMFEAMQRENIEPNDVTYLSILNACSHAGLVDKCHELFLLMVKDGRIEPRLEHLTCVVGLLGQSGRLEDAEDLITRTPLQHDSAIWLTLLSACRTHGDVSRGEWIADVIFKLGHGHEAAYVMLANLYFATGRLHDIGKLEQVMYAQGLNVAKVDFSSKKLQKIGCKNDTREPMEEPHALVFKMAQTNLYCTIQDCVWQTIESSCRGRAKAR